MVLYIYKAITHIFNLFLKENPFLVVDTIYFSSKFKERLLEKLDSIELVGNRYSESQEKLINKD